MIEPPQDLEDSIAEQLYGAAADEYGTYYCKSDLTPHCGSCLSDDDYGIPMEMCCEHSKDIETALEQITAGWSEV